MTCDQQGSMRNYITIHARAIAVFIAGHASGQLQETKGGRKHSSCCPQSENPEHVSSGLTGMRATDCIPKLAELARANPDG